MSSSNTSHATSVNLVNVLPSVYLHHHHQQALKIGIKSRDGDSYGEMQMRARTTMTQFSSTCSTTFLNALTCKIALKSSK